MQLPGIPLLLAGCLTAATAAAQPLVCPPAPAGRPCEAFHYHVALYRPDNRTFTEVYAAVPFATQAACDRAREQQLNANAKVVDFFRNVKEQQYPPDRFGPCHCDMTTERSSATYLADPQRVMQLRNAEEIRLRVRERLLDNKVPSDSELVRGLYAEPPSTPVLSTPKLVPLPQSAPPLITTSPDELQPTRTLDTTKPSVAALDLPLVDLTSGAPPPTAVPAAPALSAAEGPALSAAEGSPPPGLAPTGAESPAPIEEPATPIEETRVEQAEVIETQEAPAEDEQQSAQETAERFVNYETQRIQNVLRASAAIADENVKTRIFEAAMERIQLLSNLRSLIEGSGTRSRLAAAARDAVTEEARVAFVARLFGDDIRTHWAPKDAADVLFETDSAVASAPERALRDGTGQFTAAQKKHALYLVLATTQPTEDQRLWLSTVVEGFLR